jgi:NarL family two-component system response regulator LiaR
LSNFDYIGFFNGKQVLKMLRNTINKNKQSIFYGVCLAVLLLLLKWLEWRFIVINHSIEIYAAAIAVIFTAVGVWLAVKLITPKVRTLILEKPVYTGPGFILNQAELNKLRLSNRELEVLQLMAEGLSNQGVADRLFVSLNTVKTHSSNVFMKLEVERRTQAVEKAKRLHIIP